jgi:hypothetical protein
LCITGGRQQDTGALRRIPEMLIWDITVLVGLLLTAVGAAVAASGVIINREVAAELSGTYWNETLALKAALLKQSRTAAAGLALISIGTFLQMGPILWALTRYS